jgi:hypothetical protein
MIWAYLVKFLKHSMIDSPSLSIVPVFLATWIIFSLPSFVEISLSINLSFSSLVIGAEVESRTRFSSLPKMNNNRYTTSA